MGRRNLGIGEDGDREAEEVFRRANIWEIAGPVPIEYGFRAISNG